MFADLSASVPTSCTSRMLQPPKTSREENRVVLGLRSLLTRWAVPVSVASSTCCAPGMAGDLRLTPG